MQPFLVRLFTSLSWFCLFVSGMTSTQQAQRHQIKHQASLLNYDQDAASTRFILPCSHAACAAGPTPESRSLDLYFDLQVLPSSDAFSSKVLLNSQTLTFNWNKAEPVTQNFYTVNATDGLSRTHLLSLSTLASVDSDQTLLVGHEVQDIVFSLSTLDGVDISSESLGFSALISPTARSRLRQLAARPHGEVLSLTKTEILVIETEIPDSPYDLAADAASLVVLEAQAEVIRKQIAAKKQAISSHLKTHRDNLSLEHLLAECDTLICSARVIAQRICDKIGVETEPSFGVAKMTSPQGQAPFKMAQDQKSSKPASQNETHSVQQSNLKLMLNKNETLQEYNFVDLINPTNPLVRALQIICGILGLTALCGLIRSRCASMRTKVDRAAAREERKTARAYRRAARRAAFRRNWNAFVDAINCFGRRKEAASEDYEEKRALILQDAFLEQLEDLDQAEKGQVMEAEIRQLRHAHDIVAGLVRTDERRQQLTRHIYDPPPSFVPIPRSRASTQTLPRYTSDVESLPEYSSRPATLAGSSSSVFSSSPSVSDDEGGPPSTSPSSHTRYTQQSSVIDTTSRISQETLRTRQSKTSRGRPSMEL